MRKTDLKLQLKQGHLGIFQAQPFALNIDEESKQNRRVLSPKCELTLPPADSDAAAEDMLGFQKFA